MKIDLNKLTELQRENLEAAIQAYQHQSAISSASPVVLYIELTRNCVARCSFCHGADWVNKPQFTMKDEIFDIILRDYVPYATLVDLRGWGESLCLPEFPDYLETVAKFHPQIRLTTTLGCGSEKALQSLIDHDVFVSVSFDAADKALYENIRQGLSYETVIRNIKFVTQGILQKHGSLEGRFRLGVAPLQALNLEQLEKIVALAKKFEIREVQIGSLNADSQNPNLLKYHIRKTVPTLLKAIQQAKSDGIELLFNVSPFEELKIREKIFDRCCHPWLYCAIDHTGEVGFCDHLIPHKKIHFMGNVAQAKETVWNGKLYQQLRKAHCGKRTPDLPRSCSDCYQRGRYADHEHELADSFGRWLVRGGEMECQLLRFQTSPFRRSMAFLKYGIEQKILHSAKRYLKVKAKQVVSQSLMAAAAVHGLRQTISLPSNPKISFCTTCMGRLHHLRETLLKNIKDNEENPNVEFVVLNYNSPDGLDSWARENLKEWVASGKVQYYRTEEPRYFKNNHAKNVVHKLATGDIVCNIDADNFTGKGMAEFLVKTFKEKPQRVVIGDDLLQSDATGRIALLKEYFMRLGGYEEDFNGWGFEDRDLCGRAVMCGFEKVFIRDRSLLGSIAHSTEESVKYMAPEFQNPAMTSQRNRNIYPLFWRFFRVRANRGRSWGRARVQKNFKEEILEI